jgi:pumilio homology domain family member 6
VASFPASQSASALLRSVPQENVVKMASDGMGTFVVAELCQRIHVEGSDDEKQTLSNYFSKDDQNRIRDSDVRGRDLLVQNLRRLRDD